jgi:hypothetical protein
MAIFAYDARQKMAVNLDLVDVIRVGMDNDGQHYVSFHRQVGIADRSVSGEVAHWVFDTEDERDKTYKTIVTSHGMNYSPSKGFFY